MRSLDVTIRVGSQAFQIPLRTRSLWIGSGRRVQYYWIDSSRIRTADPAVLDPILSYWEALLHESGPPTDAEVWPAQSNYVRARCYRLVAESKSLQQVYRDSYLRPSAIEEAEELSPEAGERIHDVVTRRDPIAVGDELDCVLERFQPPPEEIPLFVRAYDHWITKGVSEYRHHREEGVRRFVSEVGDWLERYRRRAGQDRVRRFANLFAYEAKVAFHRCYSDTWVAVIERLRAEHGLDEMSERFLRLWHSRNERPADDSRPPAVDPFHGQVLALHPLSAVFMNDIAALAAAGVLLEPEEFARIEDGSAHSSPAYWDWVSHILASANRYRVALDCQEAARDSAPIFSTDVIADEPAKAVIDPFAPLREFLGDHYRCESCRGVLQLVSHGTAEPGDHSFSVQMVCRGCDNLVDVEISIEELLEWMKGSD